MFASGDDGLGPTIDECVSNDGKNTTEFLPGFPATCRKSILIMVP